MKAEAKKIRTFVAIELPDSVKEFLEGVSSRLKKCGADVKWVRINGIHLTLKFLGYVDTDLVPIIERDLRLDFRGTETIPFGCASGLGAFPDWQDRASSGRDLTIPRVWRRAWRPRWMKFLNLLVFSARSDRSLLISR